MTARGMRKSKEAQAFAGVQGPSSGVLGYPKAPWWKAQLRKEARPDAAVMKKKPVQWRRYTRRAWLGPRRVSTTPSTTSLPDQ